LAKVREKQHFCALVLNEIKLFAIAMSFNDHMGIVIFGMPGAGKTTLGKRLSEAIKTPFFDLDKLIEQNQKSTIGALFREIGENNFRQLESETLSQFIKTTPTPYILTLGGGTPVYNQNLDTILSSKHCCLFWLNTPLQIIQERIKQALNERPLFSEDGLNLQVHEMYLTRVPYYSKAHILLDGSCEIDDIIQQIIAHVLPKVRSNG
jgi:shikimate kinase